MVTIKDTQTKLNQEVILIVEDEPDIANLIEILLEGYGYRVIWNQKGDEVYEILSHEPHIDLILMDLKLGEIDGLDLTSHIKKSDQWKNIPIIMVTCRNRQEDKIRGLMAGADDYITKPFNNEELLLRVKTRLRIRALEKSLRISEEKFRRLSENAKDIIYRINDQLHFDYINPAASQITGYSQDEFLSMSLQDYLNLIHNDDRESLNEVLRELRRKRGEIEVEYRLRTKKGKLVWLQEKRLPLFDENKKLLAIEGIIRNITEQKKMEERKIQIEKLKVLQQLAGGTAHNINQPLSCLKVFIKDFEERLNKTSDISNNDREILSECKLVQEAVERISDIVQKLLSIDTIETEAYPGGEIIDLDHPRQTHN